MMAPTSSSVATLHNVNLECVNPYFGLNSDGPTLRMPRDGIAWGDAIPSNASAWNKTWTKTETIWKHELLMMPYCIRADGTDPGPCTAHQAQTIR